MLTIYLKLHQSIYFVRPSTINADELLNPKYIRTFYLTPSCPFKWSFPSFGERYILGKGQGQMEGWSWRYFFKEAAKRKVGMEIIFVSLDQDEKVMRSIYKKKHGPWYAIPYGNTVNKELEVQYDITTIPQIYVFKATGEVISNNGKHEIDKLGINVLVTWV